MNRNTAGAVLMLVLAAAGLVKGNDWAVALIVVTCALAFVALDLRESNYGAETRVTFIMALATWLTTVGAMVSFFI